MGHPVRVSLRRFWVTFEPSAAPPGMSLGCGVSAWSREDALRLVAEHLGLEPPEPNVVVEDIDVSTLEK